MRRIVLAGAAATALAFGATPVHAVGDRHAFCLQGDDAPGRDGDVNRPGPSAAEADLAARRDLARGLALDGDPRAVQGGAAVEVGALGVGRAARQRQLLRGRSRRARGDGGRGAQLGVNSHARKLKINETAA